MSEAEKEQLIRDIQQMLQEEGGPDASQKAEPYFVPKESVESYPPVDTPETAGQLHAWKYDFEEMTNAAERLKPLKLHLSRFQYTEVQGIAGIPGMLPCIPLND